MRVCTKASILKLLFLSVSQSHPFMMLSSDSSQPLCPHYTFKKLLDRWQFWKTKSKAATTFPSALASGADHYGQTDLNERAREARPHTYSDPSSCLPVR